MIFVVWDVGLTLFVGGLALAEGIFEAWLLLMVGVISVIGAVGTGLAIRYEQTQQSALAKIRRQQKRREGQPRDLSALGTAGVAIRRQWYVLGRRRRLGANLLRLCVALPLALIAAKEVWHWVYGLPSPTGFVFAGLAGVLGLWGTAESLNRQKADPVLVVGEYEGYEHPIFKGSAGPLLYFGRRRQVIIDVRAGMVLHSDGNLESEPELRGRLKFGASRAVVRRLILGEHCVLLCSGAWEAVAQLGAIEEHSSGLVITT